MDTIFFNSPPWRQAPGPPSRRTSSSWPCSQSSPQCSRRTFSPQRPSKSRLFGRRHTRAKTFRSQHRNPLAGRRRCHSVWSWGGRAGTSRSSWPGWTSSCEAAAALASYPPAQSSGTPRRRIASQCQVWGASQRRGRPRAGRVRWWAPPLGRPGTRDQGQTWPHPPPRPPWSGPCSRGWRRWRWPRRRRWTCWRSTRRWHPCGSCGWTCCSFRGPEGHRFRLHTRRRSECRRLKKTISLGL